MVLTVTISPCVDRSVFIDKLEVGEIIRAKENREITGGKGVNVSRLLHTLGKKTTALVAVGGLYGKKICELINKQEKFKFVPIWVNGESRIITTVLDRSNNIYTSYVEPSADLDNKDRKNILTAYLKYLPKSKFVVLSGSIPEGRHNDIFKEMLLIAKKRNIKCVLDSRGSSLKLAIKAVPFMVKPNVEEAEDILGRKLKNLNDYYDCVDYCISLGIELVVITRGSDSVLVGYKGKKWQIIPPKVKVVNPVGSGDALVAGIVASILDGKSILHSVKYGVAAGTVNTETWDVCYCKRKDIDKLFKGVRYVELIKKR